MTACKTAITLLCGGVGYALAQACAPGIDGKGGFAAGMLAGNVLQGVVSEFGKDAADWFAGAGGWREGVPGRAARSGHWVAVVLHQLGRFVEAIDCLAPVSAHEAEVQAALGPFGLAVSHSNLASIQRAQLDLAGARESIDRALAIQGQHFGPDHPLLAALYSNLAMIQQPLGDVVGARASMERALAIQAQHFAPDHPALAISYLNLASILWDMGDSKGACANRKTALAIALKHFDESHRHVIAIRLAARVSHRNANAVIPHRDFAPRDPCHPNQH